MESFNTNERGKCCKFSLSHRLQQLDIKYKATGGKFKNYKISDLFNIYSPAKRFNANAVKFGGKFPYVVRTSKNNGIRDYITEDEKYLSPANTFSFGQDTATVFYQDKPYFTGDKIKVMRLKVGILNKERACYLLSVIRKAFSNFSWGQNSFDENVLNNVEIVVPTKNNQIDFDYMEERIHVLEEERIHVLEVYLKVTGLDKYILTKEEQESYELIHNGERKFKLYTIGNLFDIATGRDFIIGNAESGNIPLISHTNTNNGVVNYVKYVESRRIFKAQTTIALADRGVFYATTQFKDFHIGTRVKALTFKNGEKSEESRLFVTTAINKLQLFFVEYLTNATDKLPKLSIYLPVNQQDEIDYEFMETYIRAIEKKVIKNVIDWKDKEIERTKDVVSSVS